MPIGKYYGGHGKEVMKKMKSEYGREKGERVFYATANKMKSGGSKTAHRSVMGRKVVHHSPDKHPEQSDPYSQMDRDIEKATQGQPSTLPRMRQEMKPLQRETPSPAKRLDEYLRKLRGEK